jgi:hypothetical protein
MVRAKFKVESNTHLENNLHKIILRAVYGKDDPNHENTKFFNYTPNGLIDIGIVKGEAGAYFKPGREYYVDFTDATPVPSEESCK